MDEPFGALDAFTRDEMNLLIQEIWMETGKTITFVTHTSPRRFPCRPRCRALPTPRKNGENFGRHSAPSLNRDKTRPDFIERVLQIKSPSSMAEVPSGTGDHVDRQGERWKTRSKDDSTSSIRPRRRGRGASVFPSMRRPE